MKKITSFILAMLLISSLGFAAFADLGEPDFDDWYVYCGIDGFDFENQYYANDEDFMNGENPIKFTDHVKPGMKVQVYYFERSEKKYSLLVTDDRFNNRGFGPPMFSVTEAQLNSKFLDKKEPVSKTEGIKKEKSVSGIVTSDVGVNLRQGPSADFRTFRVVPHKAKVSYQYVCKNDGYNWGYVTYKGTSGWICIDYVKESVSKKNKDKTKKKKASEQTAEQTTEQPTQTETAPTAESTAITSEKTEQITEKVNSLFENTDSSIIIYVLCAVVIALTACVILLIILQVRKKKN